MAEENDQESKTEEPTERRMEDAFEEGQFANAPEISVVAVLTAAYGAFLTFGKTLAMGLSEAATSIFSNLANWEINEASTSSALAEGMTIAIGAIAPIVIACFLAAIAAGGMQTNFQLTPKVLQIKFSRLDPIAGFKRLCSVASLIRFGIDLLKFIVIGFVLYSFIMSVMDDPIFHFRLPVTYLGEFVFNTSIALLGRLIAVLGIVATLSYFYQKRKLMQDLKMTLQDVKDERKRLEMSPQIKSARRQMARRLLNKQMLSKVPLADVIVTNPTHYAIALKYERGKDEAPMILAKGENNFARRIIALANEAGVPRVENRPVARLLFKLGKVGQPIPLELYQIVAEILAYVYRTHRYYFHRLKARRLEEDF